MGILDYLKVGAGALAALTLCYLYNVTIDNPSVRKEALAGYVLKSEKISAEAKAAEMERQRNAATQSLEEYRKRAASAEKAKKEANERLEKLIAEDSGDDGLRWNDADVEWLRQH